MSLSKQRVLSSYKQKGKSERLEALIEGIKNSFQKPRVMAKGSRGKNQKPKTKKLPSYKRKELDSTNNPKKSPFPDSLDENAA